MPHPPAPQDQSREPNNFSQVSHPKVMKLCRILLSQLGWEYSSRLITSSSSPYRRSPISPNSGNRPSTTGRGIGPSSSRSSSCWSRGSRRPDSQQPAGWDPKASNKLLILVTAYNETRIKEEIQAERIADWLHGITCVKPESDLASSFISQPHTPADQLHHLCNIITRDVKPTKNKSPITAHPHRLLVGAPFEHVLLHLPPARRRLQQDLAVPIGSDRSHLTIQIPEIELDRIKEIYGESIGYYFAFLNFYFQALVFPTLLGLLFWATGMAYSSIYSMWKVKEKLLAIKWNAFNCHKVKKKCVKFIPKRIITHFVTHNQRL
ncbi:hypothetical protein PTTG_01881 [Puccinia triticina 1-1 BBBD Race 1]|uniref:Uncharacterized protein n=1 Tax=Puccinia triticina (isolate 1-1 / race 1 (BBBD)) TaxID=630390 RepID=A0A180G8C9_PUCT1|nr:hypothetical protein PTTG_01881 [Puccinia triticina 1-1 BBBD Race 1]